MLMPIFKAVLGEIGFILEMKVKDLFAVSTHLLFIVYYLLIM